MPSLWDVLIDQFDQPKLAGEIVEGGNAAKLGDPSPEWLGLRMLELFQQGIGRTQILEDNWTGPSVDAALRSRRARFGAGALKPADRETVTGIALRSR